MRGEPRISVIIPIYNTAEYLPRCLDSILCNTYQNLEIICINDGSTDDSAAILERYAAVDPRIIAVNMVNAGVSAARNTGLDMATGDFISFIDSDDWIHPQYFELLVYFQKKTDADIVAGRYLSVTETQPIENPIFGKFHFNILNFRNIMTNGYLKRMIWGRIYRRECIGSNRFQVGIKWGEDTIFNVSVLCNAAELSAVMVDEVIYFYFQRASSAVNTLKTIDKVPVCQFYLNQSILETDTTRKSIFFSECAKQLLAHRYAAKVCLEHEAYRQCQELIEECSRALRKSSVPPPKKAMLLFFFSAPWCYRLYRIIDDPTLLKWERTKRKG